MTTVPTQTIQQAATVLNALLNNGIEVEGVEFTEDGDYHIILSEGGRIGPEGIGGGTIKGIGGGTVKSQDTE